MSRMYDRMMRHWREREAGSSENLLPYATVFELSNVASYYAENILQDGKSRMSLMENPTGWLAPLQHAFFEWRPPRGFYADEAPYHAVGWHFTTVDRVDLGKKWGDKADVLFLSHAQKRGYAQAAQDMRWLCLASLYLEQPKGRPNGPLLELTYGLDHDAQMVRHDDEVGEEPSLHFSLRPEMVEDNEDPNAFVYAVSAELQVVTLAVAFMHCKNVLVDPNVPQVKLNKRHRRKHGADLVTYYTLAIEPMREVLRRESGGARMPAERALHICRGHFATYSSDKPLFGKYYGTFWKPQHVRGSKVHGEVVKDYSVKAPQPPN